MLRVKISFSTKSSGKAICQQPVPHFNLGQSPYQITARGMKTDRTGKAASPTSIAAMRGGKRQ
jgi:hypothetical protein